MIFIKAKARKNIIDEFKKEILPSITDSKAKEFIDDVLVPYSEAYNFVKNPANSEYLKWLNMLDNSDWVPAAMLYYDKNKNNSAGLDGFFRKLERLAYMLVCSYNVNQRIARYARILSDLEASDGESVDLSDREKKDFADRLNSDVYIMTSPQKKYIILRLDSFLAETGAQYDHKVLSIEHILPQTVDDGSYWSQKWPDVQEREKWLHKVGNLIPLSRHKNSSASNYDFTKKKNVYFFKNGATPYVLASQIMPLTDWTPAEAEKRQASLIALFKQNWEL
ncbi:MAG: HNH endonuclease [Synergistaceae bacterium]|nr:HNH endonuclease [Synergistaceae bacterium]